MIDLPNTSWMWIPDWEKADHSVCYLVSVSYTHLDVYKRQDLTTLRTPIVLNGCETRSLAKESLLVMASPDHPLFEGRTSIRLEELSEQRLILSHRYRKYMLSAFERAGLVRCV